jgi:hypothetical protein
MFSTFDTTQVLVQDHQRALRHDARTGWLRRTVRRTHHHRDQPVRPV